jgi:ribosomal protein S27E
VRSPAMLYAPHNLCVPIACYRISTVFSHAQTVVTCQGCDTILCQPTGGKARLTEGAYHFVSYHYHLMCSTGSSYRKKN